MKTLKYSIVMLLGVLILASCEQDNSFVNDVQDGPNLALFTNQSKTVSKVSGGKAYDIPIEMKVAGPHMDDVSGDVTVKVAPFFGTKKFIADSTYIDTTIQGPGSTYENRAKEGVNFSIPNNTLTLKESNNYLGTVHVKMLTKGIQPPLAVSPKFGLKVTEASGGGGGNVVNSGKPVKVILNYSCPSQLQGTYDMTVNGKTHTGEIVSAKPGLGQYVTQSVAGFFPEGVRGGFLTRGVLFSDVCGKLTVPSQLLGGDYSNKVKGTGVVSPKSGALDGSLDSFTLNYNVDGLGDFSVKFTKK